MKLIEKLTRRIIELSMPPVKPRDFKCTDIILDPPFLKETILRAEHEKRPTNLSRFNAKHDICKDYSRDNKNKI